jgi:hypothetical protein
MPTQQERKGGKEKKPLFEGGASGVFNGATLERV